MPLGCRSPALQLACAISMVATTWRFGSGLEGACKRNRETARRLGRFVESGFVLVPVVMIPSVVGECDQV